MKKLFVICAFFFFPLFAQEGKPSTSFAAKDYSSLIGMPGFSESALRLHFKLYEGYVKNVNQMLTLLSQFGENKEKNIEYSEIKRRLMWEYDGMRLHEYYFDNLGGKGTSLAASSPLAQKINQDFGSHEKWKSDFVATGSMRGIGWAVLYFDSTAKKLVNAWINEHDVGHLAGGEPILIMDVFEHAYLPDYGTERAKYIDAFFENINWPLVEKRYSDELKKQEYMRTE